MCDALWERWKSLVFCRVKRTVVRAQDLSLWYTKGGQRRYLGDNAAVVDEQYAAERKHLSWEYDYFYGFCTPLQGGPIIHFASPAYSELDLSTGDWRDGYIVHPPPSGTLICGTVTQTDKGRSMSHWWVCPTAFYELWCALHTGQVDMAKLVSPNGAVFQALAALAFDLPEPNDQKHLVEAWRAKIVAFK